MMAPLLKLRLQEEVRVKGMGEMLTLVLSVANFMCL